MSYIIVVKSPHSEEKNPLPWTYTEEDFCRWVHKAFLSGYKREISTPTLHDALNIATDFGYTVTTEE